MTPRLIVATLLLAGMMGGVACRKTVSPTSITVIRKLICIDYPDGKRCFVERP